MKNLRKALAAVMALSVMTWSCAAFAEISATGAFSGGNGAVTADYSQIADNKVIATVDTGDAISGTEMTFIILDVDTDVTDIDEDDILYIDQKTLSNENDSFTGVINLARVNGGAGAESLPEGEYPIRVGYYYDNNGVQTFGLAAATMVVTNGEEGTVVSFIWGDITGDEAIDSEDALAALLKLAGRSPEYTIAERTVVVGEDFAGYLWGDITGDAAIDSEDALAALLKLAGRSPEYTVNGETIAVGDTVQGIIVE